MQFPISREKPNVLHNDTGGSLTKVIPAVQGERYHRQNGHGSDVIWLQCGVQQEAERAEGPALCERFAGSWSCREGGLSQLLWFLSLRTRV